MNKKYTRIVPYVIISVYRYSMQKFNGVLDFYFFPHVYKVFTVDSYSNIGKTALKLLGACFNLI
jgi:hypothetical protein